jgi:Flp pilus assembly secretin CpaC
MDTERVAVDRPVGMQTFSWARFAVMMALIGTPCIACAWLFIRQSACERAQAVPAAVPADSRPLVIVIPNPSGAAQRDGTQYASPTPAPSRATNSLGTDTQNPVVQACSQSAAPHVVQPATARPATAQPATAQPATAQPATAQPLGMATGEAAALHLVAAADAKQGAEEKPANLPGSVTQTAATNTDLPQLPLPGPGAVSSVPVGPPPDRQAPAFLPPATATAPSAPATDARGDVSTGATAVALPPEGVQAPPPSPSLVLPAPGSGLQDAKTPLSPNPALLPAPNMLPIGMPSNHPMASSAWSPQADLPQPTEKELEAIRNHVEGVVDPNCILDLVQGRTCLLKLKNAARSVHVSGKDVINCTQVNGREIAIQARAVGTTLLHLTFADVDKAHDAEVRYLVRVFPALTAREPYEAIFRVLEVQIAGMFRESNVQLKLIGDAVIVMGQVRDARDAAAIVQLVVANTPWAERHGAKGSGEPLAVAGSGSPHVINRLQIARTAQHQVTLKVAVVELSRTALWSLCGKGPEVHGPGASPETHHSAGAIVPVLYYVSDGRLSAAWAAAAASSVKQATGTDGRPMPEPRQITLYGQPATVVASGQCLVTASPDKAPAEQCSATLGLHGLELSFTPVCVEGESLRMTVAASAGRPGTGHQFASTVPMREGQMVAFAGLLSPIGRERDAQRTAGRWTIISRLAGVEQATAPDRETILVILPEAVGAR